MTKFAMQSRQPEAHGTTIGYPWRNREDGLEGCGIRPGADRAASQSVTAKTRQVRVAKLRRSWVPQAQETWSTRCFAKLSTPST